MRSAKRLTSYYRAKESGQLLSFNLSLSESCSLTSLVRARLSFFLTAGRVRGRVEHVTHTQTNNLDEIINYLSSKELITKFPLPGTNNLVDSTH